MSGLVGQGRRWVTWGRAEVAASDDTEEEDEEEEEGSDEVENDEENFDPQKTTSKESGHSHKFLSGLSISHRSTRTSRRIVQVVKSAKGANRLHKIYRGRLALGASIAFWVAVFGLPLYCLQMYKLFFGQRDKVLDIVRKQFNATAAVASKNNDSMTFDFLFVAEKLKIACAPTDTGRMRNIAGKDDIPTLVQWDDDRMDPWNAKQNVNDIWCGLFPRAYLANWPQVSSFILYNTYKNTGTTITNVVQSLFGTALACWNMHIMMFFFRHGARGHVCVHNEDGAAIGQYMVIWYTENWNMDRASDRWTAIRKYVASDMGGLKGRAIFGPDGKLDPHYHWFSPGWKAKTKAKYISLQDEDCERGSIVHDDANYARWGEIACFADLMIVLCLLLASQATRSTIMSAMVWTVTFMMNFMNPDKGIQRAGRWSEWFASDYFVVLCTSVLGGVFAVVATLVPGMRLCNLANMYDDSTRLTYEINKVWKESIRYMGGFERSARRFQIETRIDALSSQVSLVKQNFDGAWWETLGLGSCGRTRRLLDTFNVNAADVKGMMHVVKSCMLTESFTGEHNALWKKMHGPAEELTIAASDLMWLCLQACTDGYIDQEEADDVREHIEHVQAKQQALSEAFHQASPRVCVDLAEENVFFFALSHWARKSTDFAEKVIDSDAQEEKAETICALLGQWLASVWKPSAIFRHDHVMFAVRNWVSIMLCFFIGYYGSGSIFDRYSSTMASTLTVLIGRDRSRHLDLQKNTQRLLAVTLGKTLPIIAGVVLSTFPCWSWGRFGLQAATIWGWVFAGMMVYFSSDMWSYVGLLIAGFGMPSLLQPCIDGGGTATFEAQYKQIGNVTVAILVQALVHSVLRRRSPRDLLVSRVRNSCDALTRGFEAAFAADLAALQAAISEATSELDMAKELTSECDPKFQLWQGGETPFRLELCRSALTELGLLISELTMIITAAKEWTPATSSGNSPMSLQGEASSGVLEILRTRPAWDGIVAQLLESVRTVAVILPDMLARTTEELWHLALREPQEVKAAMELTGVEELYAQLEEASQGVPTSDDRELTNDLRVRLTVAIRSLQNAERHFCNIEERCIKECTT